MISSAEWQAQQLAKEAAAREVLASAFGCKATAAPARIRAGSLYVKVPVNTAVRAMMAFAAASEDSCLASVSSASAEGSEDARKYLASRCDAAEQSGDRAISVNIAVLRVAFPDPMHADQVAARSRALVERIAKADPREGNAIIYDGEIAGEWEHEARAILALTASPEPVSATSLGWWCRGSSVLARS